MGLLEVVDPVPHRFDSEPRPVPRDTAATDTVERRTRRRKQTASPHEADIRRRQRIPTELADGAADGYCHVEIGAWRGRRLGP